MILLSKILLLTSKPANRRKSNPLGPANPGTAIKFHCPIYLSPSKFCKWHSLKLSYIVSESFVKGILDTSCVSIGALTSKLSISEMLFVNRLFYSRLKRFDNYSDENIPVKG